MCCISVKSIGFDGYSVVMQVNVLVLRRCRLNYLGVKGHKVCNLLLKGSESTRNNQRDKRLTTGESRYRV